jgi:hypothetical protein
MRNPARPRGHHRGEAEQGPPDVEVIWFSVNV